MSGNKYDNLENFFRSRLKDVGQSEQNWNAPPRGVLDHAFHELRKERNRKRRLLLWFAGSGLAIAIIAFISVLAFNKLEQIDKNVDQLSALNEAIPKSEPSPLESDLESAETPTESAENAVRSVRAEATESDIKPAEIVNQTTARLSQGSARNGAIAESGIRQEKSTQYHAVLPRANTASTDIGVTTTKMDQLLVAAIDTGRTAQVQPAETAEVATNDIPMLKAIPLQPLEIQQSHNVSIGSPQLNTPAKTSNLSAHLFAGHSLSSFRMMQNASPDFTLTGYDKSYSGYHLGLGLDYSVRKRLHLDVALAVSKLRNQSVYEETMAYHKANEMTDINGQLIYRAQIMMESPIGQFAGDADFALDGMSIADKAPMDNITSITQHFTVVGVTAGMNYMLFEQGRVRAYAGAGLGINYFFGLDQRMNTKLFLSGANLMDATYTMSAPSGTNAIFLSAYGSVRVQYSISKRLSLGLNLGYDRALNSVRHAQSGSDVKTYLNSFKSGLAVGYTF
jgi:hypothetical protein